MYIYIQANEDPLMANDLYKAIMKRSMLRNKFLKKKKKSIMAGKTMIYGGISYYEISWNLQMKIQPIYVLQHVDLILNPPSCNGLKDFI